MPESKTIAMADKGNQGASRMWPSLETASWVSNVANVAFIGSLVVGVVSTVLIVWMASVKEGYWDADRGHSRERIAELDRDTARLSAEAEAAKSEIAKANAESAQAKLALEKLKLPRHLTRDEKETATRLLSTAPKGDIVILGNFGDTESTEYAGEIEILLRSAGYNPIETKQRGTVFALSNVGLGILVRDPANAPPIAAAIVSAFREAGIFIEPYRKEDMDPPDMVWLSAGRKF